MGELKKDLDSTIVGVVVVLVIAFCAFIAYRSFLLERATESCAHHGGVDVLTLTGPICTDGTYIDVEE